MGLFHPQKPAFPFWGLLSPGFPPAFPVLSLCGVRLSPRFSSACPLLGLCFRRRLRASTWSQEVTLQHQANHIAWYSCYILFLLHNYGFQCKERHIYKKCAKAATTYMPTKASLRDMAFFVAKGVKRNSVCTSCQLPKASKSLPLTALWSTPRKSDA